ESLLHSLDAGLGVWPGRGERIDAPTGAPASARARRPGSGWRRDVLRGGVLGRLGQADGVAAERPPQVKPVDDQGCDGAAAGGDGDHETGVAEDEGDTDAGQDTVDGGNHPTGGEDNVQPA